MNINTVVKIASAASVATVTAVGFVCRKSVKDVVRDSKQNQKN